MSNRGHDRLRKGCGGRAENNKCSAARNGGIQPFATRTSMPDSLCRLYGMYGKGAFGVRESGAEPAEGKGVKVMGGLSGINSLRYILLCGVRPSVWGGFGPLGLSCLSPFTRERLTASLRVSVLKNYSAVFVALRLLWPVQLPASWGADSRLIVWRM